MADPVGRGKCGERMLAMRVILNVLGQIGGELQ